MSNVIDIEDVRQGKVAAVKTTPCRAPSRL